MAASPDPDDRRPARRSLVPLAVRCAVVGMLVVPFVAACENGGSGDSVPALPGVNAPMPSGISPPPAVRNVSPTPDLRGEER